ncbi:MAG: hypothetical protein AAGB11_18030 [Pseudomonadota bacterium]
MSADGQGKGHPSSVVRGARWPAVLALAFWGLLGAAGPAAAQDACFDHNGSTMRIIDRGGQFTISYERPRDVLRRAGVRAGTVLAFGRSTDGGFTGTARRFSRHCVGRPLEYEVSGYYEGDYSVVLTGTRPVYERCQPTGRTTFDELFFDYVGEC